MRISGYGSGTDSRGTSKDRRKAFRRSHSVGQRVVGAFKAWHDDTLAWVEIDGQPLLAKLDADPRPGQRFMFLIKQLDPDITLQVLQPGGAGAAALAQMAQEFWGARIIFEIPMQNIAPHLLQTDKLEQRKKIFFNLLHDSPEAAAGFEKLQRSQQQITSWLQAVGKGRLVVAPWLLPEAKDFELLVAPGDKSGTLKELTASFALPELGHCELRMLIRPPKARFRLLLERPEHAEPVQQSLGMLTGSLAGLELEPGGTGWLPPGPRTLLGPYLQDESQHILPRFSTHV